jgi:hypothetical protein
MSAHVAIVCFDLFQMFQMYVSSVLWDACCSCVYLDVGSQVYFRGVFQVF